MVSFSLFVSILHIVLKVWIYYLRAPQRFKYNEQKKINASKVVNGDDYHPLKLITVKTTSAIKTSTVKKTQKTTQNNPKYFADLFYSTD